ncbi:MAG: hypothetical protein AAGJ80_17700, partial [Cyanobacteria bacterium J06553_1]
TVPTVGRGMRMFLTALQIPKATMDVLRITMDVLGTSRVVNYSQLYIASFRRGSAYNFQGITMSLHGSA